MSYSELKIAVVKDPEILKEFITGLTAVRDALAAKVKHRAECVRLASELYVKADIKGKDVGFKTEALNDLVMVIDDLSIQIDDLKSDLKEAEKVKHLT